MIVNVSMTPDKYVEHLNPRRQLTESTSERVLVVQLVGEQVLAHMSGKVV